MKLVQLSRPVLMGLLMAGLQACGSGGADPQSIVASDTANYIDTNKNGVKDADEVWDANHNDADDAAECLAGDDDHNGVIEGNERHGINDTDHNGIDDESEQHGVSGACSNEASDDDVNDDVNDDTPDKKKTS